MCDWKKYTPWVLKNAKEILAICQAENQEFNTLYGQIWRWFANTFIFNTDIAGLRGGKKMLGIYPPEGASIFDRRAAIFLMVNGTTPYTEKSFEVLTDGMYHKGAVTLGVHPNSYTVVLNLADDMTERINEIRRYARLIIPANMTIQAAKPCPFTALYMQVPLSESTASRRSAGWQGIKSSGVRSASTWLVHP